MSIVTRCSVLLDGGFEESVVDAVASFASLVELADSVGFGVSSDLSSSPSQLKLVVSDLRSQPSAFILCSGEQLVSAQDECHLLNLSYKC